MRPSRHAEFGLDFSGLVCAALLLVAPLLTTAPLYLSLTNQVAIGLTAALSVYIMLRMDLLAFTVPAFMAIGGYAAAMFAVSGTTNLVALLVISFVAPAIIAVPLGALVLRLKGVYFVFITYIFNEILQLVIFETPDLTGGSNGIPGVPPASLFGFSLETPRLIVLVTVGIAVLAAALTFAVTQRFRPEFASIEENETLAESLGVGVWFYRTLGFVASAGVSGLAGFALVNQLSTAHPSSFSSFSAINYIAYVFIGGRKSLLGVFLGATLLIVLSNLTSSQGAYSAGLFGLLLVVVVMIAPTGLVGAWHNVAVIVSRATKGSPA